MAVLVVPMAIQEDGSSTKGSTISVSSCNDNNAMTMACCKPCNSGHDIGMLQLVATQVIVVMIMLMVCFGISGGSGSSSSNKYVFKCQLGW